MLAGTRCGINVADPVCEPPLVQYRCEDPHHWEIESRSYTIRQRLGGSGMSTTAPHDDVSGVSKQPGS